MVNTSGVCIAESDDRFKPAATGGNSVSSNCLRFAKGPDGMDNTSICLKCVNFSFQL